MALSENSTKEALASTFTSMGTWIAVYDQSTSAEATGGGYARKQTTWTGGDDDGVSTGSQVEIDLPAGTYNAVGVFAASTGGSPIEKKTISAKTLDGAGKLLITPTITIS